MPRGRPRQVGLTLVSDLSEGSFAEFLLKVSKKPRGAIEGIVELTRQQLVNVCAALASHVGRVLPEATNAGLDEETETSEEAIHILHGAAVLALELLTKSQQAPPEQLLNTAVMLHDGVLISNLIPELEKLQVEMQDAVMRLCCAWWERQLPGNDFLVARTIPYVLLRAIQSLDHNRVSMVHMCYVIREALELLDFEDDTIRDTKRLLLMAAMHPSFLREPEGRRFIAGLFKLEPQMTRELAAIVRNQIPSGQRFALVAYGEILFRAWRDTVGPCAAEVEGELQALMQASILASTPALAAALRLVLDGLHNQKTLEKRLNPAFVRLYDPILPRAFGAANAEVRRNAVNLLVAAFPIIDPEAPADEISSRLAQQLGFLMDSLTDPCPAVREAAVEGCCRCLKNFWEILPAATSAKIISDITGKLVFDGSSRAVRIAVLRGVRKLMDSQHAQPVLKKALPSISGLLQDPDPVVRESLADLLVAASTTRGLNFWIVVQPEELLEAIAVDRAPAVARKISRMLVPSYFPNAQEGSARLGALLRSRPEAGLSFCRNMVLRFYPSDQQTTSRGANNNQNGSLNMEFTASVPTEHILQLASDLASHLLATVPRKASAPISQPTSKQSKRGKAANAAVAAGRGKAGKKRAKRTVPGSPAKDDLGGEEQQAAIDAGADNGIAAGGAQAGDGDDVILDQDTALETEEGWLAILEGLTVVADGLGAAVCHTEECSIRELEAALPEETLTQLLQAAEEQLRKPKAVKLVLQLVASLHFTSGAQSVRATLFCRLADGVLPGCKGAANDEEYMELDGHRGPQGHDAGILSQMLKTLATGNNSNKLVAMLSAALEVRQPLPLRKPVSKKAQKAAGGATGEGAQDLLEQILQGNGGHRGVGLDGHGQSGVDGDDNVACLGCKRAHPENTMLLCDGCDAPCHTHCLRPALQEVPEDAWFCWKCEAQLQAVRLPKAAAGRCVCLLLQHVEGREAMCGHPDFSDIIKAMKNLAMDEADEILRITQTGAADEPESGTTGGEAAGAEGDDRAALLGDPWGALSRYCRAALHSAMVALWHQQSAVVTTGNNNNDNEDEYENEIVKNNTRVMPMSRRTPASAKRAKRQGGQRLTVSRLGREDTDHGPASMPSADEAQLAAAAGGETVGQDGNGEAAAPLMGPFEIVPVLELSMHACVHLSELVLAEPCLAGHLAALQYSQGLLRVLHIVHQTELLNMSDQYISAVLCLCNAQAVLTHAVVGGLTEQGGFTSSAQQACVSATLQALLGIAQQMSEAVRSCPLPHGNGGAANGGAGGSPRPFLPAQQLQARMDAEATAGKESEGASSEGFSGPATATAAATGAADPREVEELGGLPPPSVALESLTASLVALLCQVGMEPLLKGPVRAGAAALVGDLLTATRKPSWSGWLGTLCLLAGQVLAADPAVGEELQEALGAPTAAEGAEKGGAGNDSTAAAAGSEDGRAGRATTAADGGGREVRRRLQKTAATAASNALQEAGAKISELLNRESPGVGTLSTILVRVCTARKMGGHAMLLLARLGKNALVKAAAAAAATATKTSPTPPPPPPPSSSSSQLPEHVDEHQTSEDLETAGVVALGATALLTLCQAACCSDLMKSQAAPKKQRTQAALPPGRYGALAKEATALAAQADSEAATKALNVLRIEVQRSRPEQHQHRKEGKGEERQEEGEVAAAVDAEMLPVGLPQARLLAQRLVSGFRELPVAARQS